MFLLADIVFCGICVFRLGFKSIVVLEVVKWYVVDVVVLYEVDDDELDWMDEKASRTKILYNHEIPQPRC